ncbi:zeta toxin family protein, partial [Methylomagnum sp.]
TREFLPNEAHCPTFINADLIAAGLSPFRPEESATRAGRLMLEELAAKFAKRENFAFETTLSGLGYARHIQNWRKAGYRVQLVFLSLRDADLAVSRVAVRVSQGGHNVPESVIRRRFAAGLHNFQTIYRELAGQWWLYDNSQPRPVLLDRGSNDDQT